MITAAARIPVEELPISPRAYDALMRNGISTLGSLIAKTQAEMERMPGIGRKSLNEIRAALADYGLHFTTGDAKAIR